MLEDLQKLEGLTEKRGELRTAWYRQILTLASGVLAILIGLDPEAPNDMAKYLLAGTWSCLGIGIVFGAIATYLEVSLLGKLVADYGEAIRRYVELGDAGAINALVVAKPGVVFSLSGKVMVLSLLLAVCCLVAYALVMTLGA